MGKNRIIISFKLNQKRYLITFFSYEYNLRFYPSTEEKINCAKAIVYNFPSLAVPSKTELPSYVSLFKFKFLGVSINFFLNFTECVVSSQWITLREKISRIN